MSVFCGCNKVLANLVAESTNYLFTMWQFGQGLVGDGSSLLCWCQLGRLDWGVEDAFPPWPGSHGWWLGTGAWLHQLWHWFPSESVSSVLSWAFLRLGS